MRRARRASSISSSSPAATRRSSRTISTGSSSSSHTLTERQRHADLEALARDQQILGWLGAGLVVAATGLWVAFVDFFPQTHLGGRASASDVSGKVFDMPDNGASMNLAQTFTPPAEIRHDTLLVDGWRFIK